METPLRFVGLLLVVAGLAVFTPNRAQAQWRYGGSTEFFAPLADLNDISLMGLTITVYAGRELKRGQWAIEFDTGIHWFLPDDLTPSEVPEWVPNPEPDTKNLVHVTGTFIPLRGSITRFFGRYYVSPRLGAYIPTGDFRQEADLTTRFGVAPRIGYLFLITYDTQFDLAFEYNYLFGDPALQYAGVSMGILFGGRRLRR